MRAPAASGELRLVDWFCGAGGSTQGAARVPGVPVAEILIAALVECIQGHDIDWDEAAA